MGDSAVNSGFWRNRPVFITGHTGFKGGWLASWLMLMGAQVTGYALAPDTDPAYFNLCRLDERMSSIEGDVCDELSLREAVIQAQPEVIFHLAAQPLVRRGYREPVKTFAINVMGTANILEIARSLPSIRAIVIVTSDKCYDLSGPDRALREIDPLGGEDPYSASKACSELVATAYQRSFRHCGNPLAMATVRAGNVIGGGDWAEDRLVPDAVRALHKSVPLIIRNADAVRPWQHVLEPLSGYLMLAQRLLAEGSRWSGAWNFGPPETETVEVARLADRLVEHWGSGRWQAAASSDGPREARFLRLDSSKAMHLLRWRPRLDLDRAIKMTVDWYRTILEDAAVNPYQVSCSQIAEYLES